MSVVDLNKIGILTDGEPEAQEDHSITDGDISAYFKNLKQILIHHIESADIIVGSVAWLTDYEIIGEMSKKKWISIVVQKEDFLRLDMGKASKRELRERYDKLHGGSRLDIESAKSLVRGLSYCGDNFINPIRCLGNHNGSQNFRPRAHNKFVVFCRNVERQYEKIDGHDIEDDFKYYVPEPYAMWTGSFNFSFTASLSFENAIYTTRSGIVQAYFSEWEQILALSEPLDWTSEWVDPQWRIGS